MFRTLAQLYTDPTLATPPPPTADAVNAVFSTSPVQLSRWLEEVWGEGGITNWPAPGVTNQPLGNADIVSRLGLPATLTADGLRSGIVEASAPPPPPPDFGAPPFLGSGMQLPWDHLIYAYLVESTGIVNVLGDVVRRLVVGETLDAPSVDTITWARATEEMFFRDPPLFHITGLTSRLRPDGDVNRRNVYWRMFGFDLPHGTQTADGGQPWKRDVGPAPNTRFLELWNELLRQVWLGIENERNAVGANPTDRTYIAYLCQTLGELLRLRRRGGMLARDEFAYVSMLSWFHLTVESDTAVVNDLRATAGVNGNPADRLAAIAGRVGLSIGRNARELFELADRMSPILWFIELGMFNSSPGADLLWELGIVNPVIAQDMERIIDLWQSATGNRVKDLAVTSQAGAQRRAQPTRLPASAGTVTLPSAPALLTPSGTSTNGHTPSRA